MMRCSDLIDYERVTRLLEKRVIEVAPLAFMRAGLWADAFIILDEAQNTTSEQMKNVSHAHRFWLEGSNHRRLVTQVDLPQANAVD